MKNMLTWLWLLTKRLYKKPAFLAFLVLIPVVIFCYHGAMDGQSGVMTVALAQEGSDPLAAAIIEDLQADSSLLRYQLCSPEEARQLVAAGKVDAAWIFPADMEAQLQNFLEDPRQENACVTVLQREDNVAHRLARERLSGQLYHQLSERFYLQYLRSHYGLETLTDQELMAYYHNIQIDEGLFVYESVNGGSVPQVHYLMGPVRGILGVLAVLCGMAVAMYQVKDREKGTFAWLPPERRLLPEGATQLVAVMSVVLVAWVALAITGHSAGFFMELAVLVLYTLCVAAFGMLLGTLIGNVRVLGALMPLLAVVMLLVCPVFLDLGSLRLLQLLFPPTYYILGAYNPMYLLYMVLHTIVCLALCLLTEKLKKH